MTGAQATAAGPRCDCRALPLHVPRAQANRDTRGLVKLVADAGTGRVLGQRRWRPHHRRHLRHHRRPARPHAPLPETMTEALKVAAQAFTADVARLSCRAG